jgi:hypothetical protein
MLPQMALANGAGPDISSVVVLGKTSTTAAIFWTTNTDSDSRVNYGTNTTVLGNHKYDSHTTTTHLIELTGLTPGKTYYFEVVSADGFGTSTDDNDGAYYQFTTLSVATYSIILDSVCGVCGDLIEAGICGEIIGVTALVPTAGTYHICWDSPSAANVKATFTVTSPGSYTTTFFLPEAKKGIHKVYLVDSSYTQRAEDEYEVLPSVKMTPEEAEGPVGTSVTLNGYGFNASQAIEVKFTGEVIATATASAVGSWSASYTIAATPGGDYTFDIEAKEGTVWVNWVSKYFEVTPRIVPTPDSGAVGHTIEVSGTGFGNREKDIKITLGGKVVKEIPYAEENGSWTATVIVPSVQKGSYMLDASGRSTRARDVQDVEFFVSAGLSVDPISAYIGDTVTVEGGGFAPFETGVRVSFDGVGVSQGAIPVDSNGRWEASFIIPTSAYGPHTVSASGDLTKSAASTTFSTQARILEVSPDEGGPGDLVYVTGDGFGSSGTLTVTIGGIAPSGHLTSGPNGGVSISFRVPKDSSAGTRMLVVSDGSGATDSCNFTVVSKPLSTTPLPVSPKDNTLRSGVVAFRWQGIPNSTDFTYTYTLELSQNASSGSFWSMENIAASNYTWPEDAPLDGGTYYWRVMMEDNYGNEGPWSDPVEFRVSPIHTWVWVVIGLAVLIVLMVVAYRETRFRVTE